MIKKKREYKIKITMNHIFEKKLKKYGPDILSSSWWVGITEVFSWYSMEAT